MKTGFFLLIILLLIVSTNNYSQVDYSNPKNVAQSFLDLCLEGKRIEACQLYCTERSVVQIEILLKQLVMKDIPLVNMTCKYVVDSCKYDQAFKTAKCYYNKICSDVKMNKKGYLTLRLIEDKWMVEYIWKRDRYL